VALAGEGAVVCEDALGVAWGLRPALDITGTAAAVAVISEDRISRLEAAAVNAVAAE
jgi:hypothetical protein